MAVRADLETELLEAARKRDRENDTLRRRADLRMLTDAIEMLTCALKAAEAKNTATQVPIAQGIAFLQKHMREALAG